MLKIIVIFAASIVILSSCAPGIKNLNSKGTTIICFGDSITEGQGASEEESYPKILEKLTGKEIINTGRGGDTTSLALNRLGRDVLLKEPYLVIIELGGNDYLQQVPRKVTLNNLEEMIMKIQEGGAMVALCDMSSGFFLSGYRNDFKELAAKTGCIFIPRLMEGILDNPTMRSDEIHPNNKGYILIAKRVYQAIKKYIKN